MPAPDPDRERDQEARSAVRKVYAELTARPVERSCTRLTECCQFKLTGAMPYLTKGEAMVAAQGFKGTGRKEFPEREDGTCPMLQDSGKCMIYADRPFGCRTHFCQGAGGPYARTEVIDLIRKLEEIDRKLQGTGPVPLARAIGDAFAALKRELRETRG